MSELPIFSGQLASPNEKSNYRLFCRRCDYQDAGGCYRSCCPDCDGPLDFTYVREPLEDSPQTLCSMWKYAGVLPINNPSRAVTLGEGNTPLIRARTELGIELFLKNETANPTGSHKDRAISVAMTKALEFNFEVCMLYSDGSAALSSAAYAARAGIHNITIVPQGCPDYRLLPLMVYASTVLEYMGPSAEALDWVHSACQELGIYETTTYRRANPYQSEGPKTMAYEIVEQLGRPPEWCLVPVGGGGTLAGVWRGFCDLLAGGEITRLPKLAGILPQHYSLLQKGLERGITTDVELRELGKTIVPDLSARHTAQAKLAMAFPPDGIEAIAAIRDSGGVFLNVSDADALTAQLRLGAREGIYVEISAAVSLAALSELRASGEIKAGDTVVALLCGSGFRETGELARTLVVKKLQVDQHSGMKAVAQVLKAL